jgi:hypothetical protein
MDESAKSREVWIHELCDQLSNGVVRICLSDLQDVLNQYVSDAGPCSVKLTFKYEQVGKVEVEIVKNA